MWKFIIMALIIVVFLFIACLIDKQIERENSIEKDKALRNGYEIGIIKGKVETIDKACEWLINTYLGDYVTDEFGNGGIGDNVKLAEDLRKALEE